MKIIKENSIDFIDKISLEVLSRLTSGENDNHLFLSKNNEKYYPLQLNLSNLSNNQQQIINRISMNFIKIYMINKYQINAKMDNFCLNLCKKIIEFSYKFDIDLIKTNAAAPLFFDLSDENIEVNIFASLNSKQTLILNIINNQSTEIFAIRKSAATKKYSIYECFHFDESMASIGNIDLLNDNTKKEVKIQNNLFPTKISTKDCRIFTINFSLFSIKNLVYNSLNVIEERPDLWLKNNYFSLFYDHENVLSSSKNDEDNKIIDTILPSMDIYYQFFPFLYSISADSSSYKMIKYNNSTSAAPKKNIFLPINTSMNFELNNAADLSFSNILFKNSLTGSIRYLINDTYVFGCESGFLYPFHNILKNLLGIKIKDEYIKHFNMIERAANSKKTKFNKRLFASSAGTTKNEYFTVFNVNIVNNINNDNKYCHFCSIPLCDCAVLCLHGLPHGGNSLHKKITKSNKNLNNIIFINQHWPQLNLNSKYILAAACTKCYSSGGFSTSVFEKNENIHLFSFFPVDSSPSFLNIVFSTLLLNNNNNKNITDYTGQEIESSIYFDLIRYIYETIISSVKSFRPLKQTENTTKNKKKGSKGSKGKKGSKEKKESEENDLFERVETNEDTSRVELDDYPPKVGDKKKVVHKPEWYERWDRPINTSKFITSAAFPHIRYLLVNHIDCNTPSSCNCNKLFMRDPAAFHKNDEKVFIGKYYYILTK